MRRRWASSANDPGWTAREIQEPTGPNELTTRQSMAREVRKSYTAGERLIDCPRGDCAGLLLTGSREVERHGSAARITLRCTREPDNHEVTLLMEPYDAEEADALKSFLLRGDRLACVRCEKEMKLGTVSSPDGWGKSGGSDPAYYCLWCGLRWVPPLETKQRAG